jgi:ribosomal protein L5
MKKMHWCASHLGPKDMISSFPTKNLMMIPRVSHLVFHTSGSSDDEKSHSRTSLALQMISGQKPIPTRAKNFVAGFKIRTDQLLGTKVTLRKKQLFSCLEKFHSIFLPASREWTGLCFQEALGSDISIRSTKLIQDEQSSSTKVIRTKQNVLDVSFGCMNFLLFPECGSHYELFENLHGFQIHILYVTSKRTHSRILLTRFLLSSLQYPCS